MIDFNKKMLKRILVDLRRFSELKLSCLALEKQLQLNMGALDSTIPSHIQVVIEIILLKLDSHQQEQLAVTLNTDEEGTYDQNLPVNGLLDSEMALIEKYISSRVC